MKHMRVPASISTRWITLIVWLLSAGLFFTAPMHVVEDSRYSLLVSRAVIDHGTFDLSVYHMPRYAPNPRFGIMPNGYPYHLYPSGTRLFYYYPPGSSLLAIPAVWVAGALGVSPVGQDGSYDNEGEAAIEAALAALLCAVVVALFFRISLLWLPYWPSLGIAFVGGFCTPVLSTLSRALWSQTWLVTLLTFSLWLLCRALRQARTPNIWLLASCTALMYVVRPTAVVPILAISLLVWHYWRTHFAAFLITGLAWLLSFVLFSQAVYGSLLPPYYLQHLGGGDDYLAALAGSLVSPARGWLLYTPCLLLFVLPLRWRLVGEKPLLWISIGAMVLQWLLVSSWAIWWGGYSYGPRLMADSLPWLMLALVLLGASLYRQPLRQRWLYPLAVMVLAFCLYTNIGGAYGRMSVDWNQQPRSIDDDPARVWDWRHPQFRAGPYLPPVWPWPAPRYHSV